MKELQSDLDYCRKHHGGPPSAPSPADSQDATTAALPLRNESSEPEPSSENEGSSSTGDSDIERLIAPTRHLVVSPPVIISTFAPHTRTPLSGLVLWRTRQGSCALDVPPPTPTPPPASISAQANGEVSDEDGLSLWGRASPRPHNQIALLRTSFA